MAAAGADHTKGRAMPADKLTKTRTSARPKPSRSANMPHSTVPPKAPRPNSAHCWPAACNGQSRAATKKSTQ